MGPGEAKPAPAAAGPVIAALAVGVIALCPGRSTRLPAGPFPPASRRRGAGPRGPLPFRAARPARLAPAHHRRRVPPQLVDLLVAPRPPLPQPSRVDSLRAVPRGGAMGEGGGIVRGLTLTMQAARLLEPRPRTCAPRIIVISAPSSSKPLRQGEIPASATLAPQGQHRGIPPAASPVRPPAARLDTRMPPDIALALRPALRPERHPTAPRRAACRAGPPGGRAGLSAETAPSPAPPCRPAACPSAAGPAPLRQAGRA